MRLTDEQWLLLQPLFEPINPPVHSANPACLPPRRGRPASNPRPILDAVLLKLATRRPWRETRTHNPSWQTCYRAYQRWCDCGLLRRALLILHHDLLTRGEFDLQQAVRDGLRHYPGTGWSPAGFLVPLPGVHLAGADLRHLLSIFDSDVRLAPSTGYYSASPRRNPWYSGWMIMKHDLENNSISRFRPPVMLPPPIDICRQLTQYPLNSPPQPGRICFLLFSCLFINKYRHSPNPL